MVFSFSRNFEVKAIQASIEILEDIKNNLLYGWGYLGWNLKESKQVYDISDKTYNEIGQK